jgi:hypothetical protein
MGGMSFSTTIVACGLEGSHSSSRRWRMCVTRRRGDGGRVGFGTWRGVLMFCSGKPRPEGAIPVGIHEADGIYERFDFEFQSTVSCILNPRFGRPRGKRLRDSAIRLVTNRALF